VTATTEPPFAIKIAHISDLHFGAEDENKVKALKTILKESGPDFICITGDVVDRPWKSSFLKAKSFINEVEALCKTGKVYVIPGNHDAIFGGFGISRFRKFLNQPLDFVEHLPIGLVDLCIIGVNSTFPAIKDLWTSGRVTKNRMERLSKSLEKLAGDLGPFRFRNAFKIVLIHHHPLPTVTNKFEGMVYLKNSGEFLNEMVKHEISLILHGHQHDPCDFSVNYNVGGETDFITILSAGTALKHTDESDLAHSTHFYLLTLKGAGANPNELHISALNYHKETSRFLETKSYFRKVGTDPFAAHELDVKYVIEQDYDLVEEVNATIKAKPGRVIEEFPILTGVDEQADEVHDSPDKVLTVTRDGRPLSWSSDLVVMKDEPRSKHVVVKLKPPVGTQPVLLTWRAQWPKGWLGLREWGRDGGSYTADAKTDKLRITVENNLKGYSIGQFTVIYDGQIKRSSEGNRQVIEITKPARFKNVVYWLTLKRNQ